MSLRIELYHDSTRYGQVELGSLFVMGPADYTCDPKGVVTHDEVTQICQGATPITTTLDTGHGWRVGLVQGIAGPLKSSPPNE